MAKPIIWVIVPSFNDLGLLMNKLMEGPHYMRQVPNPNFTIYVSAINGEHSNHLVHHIEETYRKLQRIDYIFYLGTCVAPDTPVELSGGYASREEQIARFATFAVSSGFHLPSPSDYPAYNVQGPQAMRNLISNMATNPALDFRVRCVNGFSSDATIDRPLFEKARRTNYLTVVGDQWISTFYHVMYMLGVNSNHLALTSVERLLGEDPESNEVRDHRCKATQQVFNTFITMVTSPTFVSWASGDRPIKMEAVANHPIVPSNDARLRILEEENLRLSQQLSNSIRPPNDRSVGGDIDGGNYVSNMFYDYQGKVSDPHNDALMSENERLNHRVQSLEKEKMDLIAKLNSETNAKTEIEREHMEVIVDLVKERKRQKSEDKQEDPLVCNMCFENNINTFVLPCKHAVICSKCSDSLASKPGLPSAHMCVACRTPITAVHKFILQ